MNSISDGNNIFNDLQNKWHIYNNTFDDLPLLYKTINLYDSLQQAWKHRGEEKKKSLNSVKEVVKEVVKEKSKPKKQRESDSASDSASEASDSGSKSKKKKGKKGSKVKGEKSCDCKKDGQYKAVLRHTFTTKIIDDLIYLLEVESNNNKCENILNIVTNTSEKTINLIKNRIAEQKAEEEKARKEEGGDNAQEGGKLGASIKTTNFINKNFDIYYNTCYNEFKSYFNERKRHFILNFRKKIKYVNKFRQLMTESKEHFLFYSGLNKGKEEKGKVKEGEGEDAKEGEAKEEGEGKVTEDGWAYNDYNKFINQVNEKIKDVEKGYLTKLEKELIDCFSDFKKKVKSEKIKIIEYINSETVLDSDEYLNGTVKTYDANFQKIEIKLKSLYNNEQSIMDLIIDSHFITLYILKIIHYFIILTSLYVTEKLFSEMYMKAVYAENTTPPNLINMLVIFFVIDFGLILFLLTILFLLMYIFKSPSKEFIINIELIKAFVIDYLIYMVILLALLAIIASYMQLKKYFRYKTEGLRAIRALKDITIAISIVLIILPWFAIF